jgi:hypothetical protein
MGALCRLFELAGNRDQILRGVNGVWDYLTSNNCLHLLPLCLRQIRINTGSFQQQLLHRRILEVCRIRQPGDLLVWRQQQLTSGDGDLSIRPRQEAR